jgi:hypothetical protein
MIVVACTGIVAAKSDAMAILADLIKGVILIFIFEVGVQSKSPESGHKRDIYFAFLTGP